MIFVAKRVVLCADEESLRNPQLLGLEESNLQAVSWIECCATAEECRRAARRDGIEEAWVVSCDDMEPLNVAAALKYDDPCKKGVFGLRGEQWVACKQGISCEG